MQQVAGNIGLINPLVFNHFGYGTYAQVKMKKKWSDCQRGYKPLMVQQALVTAQQFG